ncbi:hypothetical protein [Buttiauxella gaviniae]|uniref:hypothetical protein n=1 Tax=Buttiauxella gaviniae TaxID=82990 RepID=UPI003C737B85
MKKKVILIGLAVVVAVSLASVFLVSSDGAKGAAMIGLCSDITKDHMKSPGSYKLSYAISTIKTLSPTEKENRIKALNSEPLANLLTKGSFEMKSGEVFLDFEARNSFGVALKGLVKCDFTSFSDTWSSLDAVSIDGRQVSNTDIIIASTGAKIDSGFSSKIKYLVYKVTGKI